MSINDAINRLRELGRTDLADAVMAEIDRKDNELAALKAQIAEAERQKPVAYRVELDEPKNGYKYSFSEADWWLPDEIHEDMKPLYARPVPAAVPDTIKREVEYVTMCLDGYVADQTGPTETMAQAADLIRRLAAAQEGKKP